MSMVLDVVLASDASIDHLIELFVKQRLASLGNDTVRQRVCTSAEHGADVRVLLKTPAAFADPELWHGKCSWTAGG